MITVTTVGREIDQPDWTALHGFLETALRRFQLAEEAERDLREKALADLKFFAGEQWPQAIVSQRALDGRPCLTINRLPELASQPINQQRQGRPQIQVNPRGGGATLENAQVIQGLTRHIEVASGAESAYDWAFQYTVICGFAYFRYLTEWADDPENPWDQEIRVKPILNPFTVYLDPSCEDRLCRDAKWGFIIQDYLPEDYKARFPDSRVAGLSQFNPIGAGEKIWFRDGMVRVAEYWWVEFDRDRLVQLSNGETISERDIDRYPNETVALRDGEPITRDKETRRVRSALINAREVLNGNTQAAPFGKAWLGTRIPIIPVLGEDLIVDNKRLLKGIVRDSQDAQRQYNYWRTALTEQIGLAPKAPYVVAVGQIEGHEPYWDHANDRNWPYLPYNPTDVHGTPLPPPHRNWGEPPIAAIVQAVVQADQDLKSTTRIHEPMTGAAGPEQSGRAIIARQNQGNIANFAYVDNLGQSIQRLGEDILELLPMVYGRPGRVERIVKPDQSHQMVTLNEEYEPDPENHPGQLKTHDLRRGKYDVTISVGPGYESKRQEFVASVLELVRTAPQIAGLIMDLVVRHMDWPGAQEIADRLKKMLPPQLQEEQPTETSEVPPAFAAQMEQLLQQHAQLTERLNQATTVIESRRLEVESREKIVAIQEQTKLLIAQLKADSQEEIEALRQQVLVLGKRLEHLPPAPAPDSVVPQPSVAA